MREASRTHTNSRAAEARARNVMPPTFAQLGVPKPIVDALSRRGIKEPFEIQAATIADALAGRDVSGRAPTGSGKTLAFGIPLVAGVGRAEPRRPRALILAPTRELAEQINAELRTFAGDVRIGVVYGGVGYGPQLSALRRGVDILVACPGRLEDLIEQGALSLADVDQVVLDEADRMADMGFMPAVRRLLDATASQRQTVLFSATLDGDVAKLTRDYQKNPVLHEVGEETPDITVASHVFWKVTRPDRAAVTAEAIDAAWPAIVFCRTRHGSDRVARQLSRAGIKAAAIHGGRSQAQRTRALNDFSSGRVQALVATDVASRGIHVDGVACVVHFDPPEDQKAYVHRSGRTARAGKSGVVLSLLQPEQIKEARKLQRQVGLDEPFIQPDSAALRLLSPPPTTAAAARGETSGQDAQPDRSGAPRRSHNKGPKGNHRGRDGRRSGPSHGGRSRSKSSAKSSSGDSRNGQRDHDGQRGDKRRSKAGADSRSGGAPRGRNSKSGSNSDGRNSSQKTAGVGRSAANRKTRRAHLQPGASGRRPTG